MLAFPDVADKDRLAILELQATKQRQITELKELGAKIQREGVNPATQAAAIRSSMPAR